MMIAAPTSLAGLLTLAACLSSPVSAWPGGAGTCVVTSTGPAFPSGTKHDGAGGGALSAGNYAVTVNGAAASLPEDGTPTDVTLTGNADTITVSGRNFVGFLVTLSSPDGAVDLGETLLAAGDDSQTMTSSGDGANTIPPDTLAVCPAGVGGGTHTSSAGKTTVSMQLDATKIPDGTMGLTVTVMRRARQWYHSNFVLNVSGGGGAAVVVLNNATEMPPTMPGNGTDENTMVPTVMPTMPAENGTDPAPMTPTMMPNETETATMTPTMMPTANTSTPTVMPTMPPVNTSSPTSSPTSNPITASPTSMPTEMPTMMPITSMPTSMPSSMPSSMPTTMPVTDMPTTMPVTDMPTQMPVTDTPTSEPSMAPTTGGGAITALSGASSNNNKEMTALWTGAAAVVGTAVVYMLA